MGYVLKDTDNTTGTDATSFQLHANRGKIFANIMEWWGFLFVEAIFAHFCSSTPSPLNLHG